MPSATVENYVKAILALSLQKGEGQVGMGEIARSLEVAPGTATSMTKTLEREKLVRYKARQGVILTAKGRKLGMGMLRRHRLVETFLVETLGLDWTEIHHEAEIEQIEGTGARIVGINNRDLTTFQTDLATSVRLSSSLPDSIVRVSESGIRTADDVERLAEARFDAILVGEAIVTSPDPTARIVELVRPIAP